LVYVLADLAKVDMANTGTASIGIEAAASRIGVQISDQTVKKYLDQAAEYRPSIPT
jgi:hypothetical protein